jgi:hypothetical protein
MRKTVATLRALISRRASIDSIGKTLILRTPGEVTEELGHN